MTLAHEVVPLVQSGYAGAHLPLNERTVRLGRKGRCTSCGPRGRVTRRTLVLRRTMAAAAAAVAVLALAACGGTGDSNDTASSDAGSPDAGSGDAPIVVGFSQVGSESGWRAANTKSIKDALTVENGFDLKFSDAQQKQENQIQAIRTYIAQGVDIIAFSPVVTSGWDEVLAEAKAAGIPVVLTDRAVDAQDESLYVTFIGSDCCLLYTSDAADEEDSVDLGGRR